MYERMSPTEKNRPINEAMRNLLPWHAEQAAEPRKGDSLVDIMAALSKLSPEKLQEFRQSLGLNSVA